ncbi:hypothetical protein [Streptomyces sp. LN699]|uniref:hypothetical protein n=1 Tax=Streptomyces sp. LN699 TaxID=3112981 RepID=UPI00371A64E3
MYTDRRDLIERVSTLWRFLLPGIAGAGMIGMLRVTPPPTAGSDPASPRIPAQS